LVRLLASEKHEVFLYSKHLIHDPFYSHMYYTYENHYNLVTDVTITRNQYDFVLVHEYTGSTEDTGTAVEDFVRAHPNVVGAIDTDLEHDKLFFKRVCNQLLVRVPSYYEVDLEHPVNFSAWQDIPVMIKLADQRLCQSRLFTYHAHNLTDAKNFIDYCRTAHNRDVGFEKGAKLFIEPVIEGTEISVGAFFNGERFLEPFHYFFEYKKLLAGNHGPNVEEMGVVATPVPNAACSKVSLMLRRFERYLREIGYRGYFDIACIIEDVSQDVFVLECDLRFPNPGLLAISHMTQDLPHVLATLTEQTSVDTNWVWATVGSMFTLGFPWADGVAENIAETPIHVPDQLVQDRHAVPVGIFPTHSGWALPEKRSCDFGRLVDVCGLGRDLPTSRRNWLANMRSIRYPFELWRPDVGTGNHEAEIQRFDVVRG